MRSGRSYAKWPQGDRYRIAHSGARFSTADLQRVVGAGVPCVGIVAFFDPRSPRGAILALLSANLLAIGFPVGTGRPPGLVTICQSIGLSGLLPIGGAPLAEALLAFLGVFVRHSSSRRRRRLGIGNHDTAGLADRAAKSPLPAAVVSRHQHVEMHSHIAGRAFLAGNTGLGGRLHVGGYPRGR
jgi:hypothetical protein